MVIDKTSILDDALDLPNDAPPAYDDVGPSGSRQPIASTSSPRRSSVEKPPIVQPSTPSTSGNASRALHLASSSFSSGPPRQDKVVPVAASPKVQSDIRETVRGLVRDVVQGFASGKLGAPDALSVLDSCAAACASHSLSLPEILQDRNIEGHSAVYWSVVSRPAGNDRRRTVNDGEEDTFLLALLSRASPLTTIGVSELRAACLALSDNGFLQRLRSLPGLVPLSGTDRMLLAGSNSRTSVNANRFELERVAGRSKTKEDVGTFGDVVDILEGGAGPNADSFRVIMQLKMFQRRMRVSGELEVEFIARGRIWLLLFFVVSNMSVPTPTSTNSLSAESVVPEAVIEAARARKLTPGTWAVALALLDGSTQCYAEAKLSISEACTPDLLLSLSDDPQSSSENGTNSRTKPTISLNLTSTGSNPLIALPSPDASSSSFFLGGLDALLNTFNTDGRQEASRKRRRTRMGYETAEEQQERARLAESVLVASFESASSTGANGRGEQRVSGRELMYEGCPYIAADGTLNAVLEARLSRSPTGPKLSDCVIC